MLVMERERGKASHHRKQSDQTRRNANAECAENAEVRGGKPNSGSENCTNCSPSDAPRGFPSPPPTP